MSDALKEVRDRLAEKIIPLQVMIDAGKPFSNTTSYNNARLRGKIEGIKLAISYIEDEMKMTEEQVEWVRNQRGK